MAFGTRASLAPIRSGRLFAGRHGCAAALILTSFLLSPRGARSDDWPFLRGPHFNGASKETGLAGEWLGKQPHRLWSRDLGQGYSACIVANGRVITQYQDAFGQYVICFRGDDGATLWSHRSGAPYDPLSIYPGPRSMPTYDNGRIYYTTPDGAVSCLASDSGTLLWNVPIQRQLRGRGTEFGYAASPLVWKGRVVVSVGGVDAAVVALDALTGEIVWKAGNDAASYCSVLPITLEQKTLFVALLQTSILILNPERGQILWREEFSTGYDEHSAWPLYAEPMLIFASPFRGGAQAYRLNWMNTGRTSTGTDRQKLSAKPAWQSTELSNDVASSLVVDGNIYGFDLRDQQAKAHRPSRGEFRCLDVQTGRVRWSSPQPGQAVGLAADGKIWLLNDHGELVVIRANPDRYEELGRMSVFPDEICWTAPALSDGRLLLRSHGRVTCLDIRAQGLSPPEPTDLRLASYLSIPWQRLLNGEREHPFEKPTLAEFSHWFTAGCLFVLLPVSILAAVACWLLPSGRYLLTTCWLTTTWGLIATAVMNAWSEEFQFTWPVALSSALLAALLSSAQLAAQPADRGRRRRARAAGLAFIAVCCGYFLVLRRLSLPHEWIFLIGLLPGTVVLWPTARWIQRTGSLSSLLVSLWIGYATLFWSAAGFSLAR
jgi:outer membrane protein assembly factor BamB